MKKYLFCIFLVCSLKSFAGIERISKGSFIVNLGISPQTKANGLKPYGLVYDLLQNFNVPVKWAINSSKSKDGIDFTYNNTPYRSGSFIVLAQYRTAEVDEAIEGWKTKGVIGETTDTEISVDIYATLNYAPKWTIDKMSGQLITPFFVNADIPASAHGGSNRTAWKTPAELTECDDIFILPHADPVWASHQNLLFWNKDRKGAIWSGCHAVSVMENIVSPDGSQSMNFLTRTGMVDYRNHIDGVPPFTYRYPADPVMQFVNKMDDATTNGSEAIYLPKANGGWRLGAKLSITSPTHSQVPSHSPGPASVLAYGFGFDDPTRGLVMYQGGHYHDGGIGGGFGGTPFNSDHVALQRAFFNFSFMAVVDRQSKNVSPQITAAGLMRAETVYPVSFSVPGNVNLSDYEVEWTASSGSITTSSDKKNISYTPPSDENIRIVLLTVALKDACGRKFFTTKNIRISNGDEQVVSARLISANEDGRGHDFLFLKNIDLYPENQIQIFNRWGIKVYEMRNYNNDSRSFRGIGNTNSISTELIAGVYYYVLTYKDLILNQDGVLKDYFIIKR